MEKKLPTKYMLRKWAKMTDENKHIEVRLKIAKFFGDTIGFEYMRFYEVFQHLQDFQYRFHHQSSPTVCLLTRYMIDEIEQVYGEEVACSVSGCL